MGNLFLDFGGFVFLVIHKRKRKSEVVVVVVVVVVIVVVVGDLRVLSATEHAIKENPLTFFIPKV